MTDKSEQILINKVYQLVNNYNASLDQLELYGPAKQTVLDLQQLIAGYQRDRGALRLDTNEGLVKLTEFAQEREETKARLRLETSIEFPLKIIAMCEATLAIYPENDTIKRIRDEMQKGYDTHRKLYAEIILNGLEPEVE